MLTEFILSLFTDIDKKTGDNTLVYEMTLIFGAVLSGYTIGNYPKPFLNFLATPTGQFFAFFIINFSLYRKKQTIAHIIAEAIIDVIVLNVIKILLEYYYDS
jgi:hypothetical protein